MYKKKVSLLVLPKNIKDIHGSKNKKKGCWNMINDEMYVTFLKRIIACISYGDYYSVKELSMLELEKMEKHMKNQGKQK